MHAAVSAKTEGKKKKNTVENHLQFRHIQLADNRERWRRFIKAPNVTG